MLNLESQSQRDTESNAKRTLRKIGGCGLYWEEEKGHWYHRSSWSKSRRGGHQQGLPCYLPCSFDDFRNKTSSNSSELFTVANILGEMGQKNRKTLSLSEKYITQTRRPFRVSGARLFAALSGSQSSPSPLRSRQLPAHYFCTRPPSFLLHVSVILAAVDPPILRDFRLLSDSVHSNFGRESRNSAFLSARTREGPFFFLRSFFHELISITPTRKSHR